MPCKTQFIPPPTDGFVSIPAGWEIDSDFSKNNPNMILIIRGSNPWGYVKILEKYGQSN